MTADITQLRELFYRYEDALMEKSALVGVAPSSMVGVQLSPEFYEDDGEQHIKVGVLLELTGSDSIDHGTSELVADTTSYWLRDRGINDELEALGVDPEVMDWFTVQVTKV